MLLRAAGCITTVLHTKGASDLRQLIRNEDLARVALGRATDYRQPFPKASQLIVV